MPLAWYIVPYVRITPPRNGLLAERTIALNVDAPTLKRWREVEVLGNRAIVKIFASAGVLSQLDAAYKRLPKDLLDESLADLPNGVKNALRDEILDMGYTQQEINTRFPEGIGQYTLRQALKFMATRRQKPRYDAQADAIVLDGEVVACEDIDALDAVEV